MKNVKLENKVIGQKNALTDLVQKEGEVTEREGETEKEGDGGKERKYPGRKG